MTSMIFYEKPVALNRHRHRALKLDAKPGDFSFSEKTNSLLIAATEVSEAAATYPIVFVGQPGGPFTLAALVGLNDCENLFVSSSGQWEANCYVPAFARRYPFVLAEQDDNPTELTVCVDESFAALNQERGEALFDTEGRESPLLQGAVDFLKLFHSEMQATRTFTQRLADLDLLTQKTIEVNRDGKSQVLEGLYIIDQEKLSALDDDKVVQLFRTGDMALVHSHLLSLRHIERLAARMDRRIHAAAEATAATTAASLEKMPVASPVM